MIIIMSIIFLLLEATGSSPREVAMSQLIVKFSEDENYVKLGIPRKSNCMITN